MFENMDLGVCLCFREMSKKRTPKLGVRWRSKQCSLCKSIQTVHAAAYLLIYSDSLG